MKGRTLSGSMEDYLEAILVLQKDNPVARAKEIAESLNVKMSSVTNALKNLSEHGYINYDKYSFITLTEKGELVAKEIYERHHILKNFLVEILGVSDEVAEDNACRMEHVMDRDVIDRMSNYIKANMGK